MPERAADDDPPPIPPVRPKLDECYNGACDSCIFDLYEEAAERYRAELRVAGTQKEPMKASQLRASRGTRAPVKAAQRQLAPRALGAGGACMIS